MVLAQLGEKVSDERGARTKFLVKKLMCALPEILDVQDIALMEDREARRDDKALQRLPDGSFSWQEQEMACIVGWVVSLRALLRGHRQVMSVCQPSQKPMLR